MLCPPEILGDMEYTITIRREILELVQVQEMRGSRLYMGGYTIVRDLDGNEIGRTPVTWNGYCEWT